jgi:hypothetical protein
MPQTTARDIILEILRSADGEWTGKTRLFKAFYFAHLYYADQHPGLLTDWPLERMPQGPGIHYSEELFADLVKSGEMTVEPVHEEGPYPESRYRLTAKGAAAARPSAAACWATEKAVSFCQGKTAAQLSQITHERSRSWIQAKDGDVLNIYLDLIPDDEYSKRAKDIADLDRQLTAILGGPQA